MLDLVDNAAISLRYAHRGDVPLLAAVDRASAIGEPWGRDVFSRALRPMKVLLAENEYQQMLGFAAFVRERPAKVTLVRLCVAPENRRRGIARTLVNELTYLVETGKSTAVAMAVRETHAPLLAMLRRSHFAAEQLVRRGFTEPSEDAVVMVYRRGGPLARHCFRWRKGVRS